MRVLRVIVRTALKVIGALIISLVAILIIVIILVQIILLKSNRDIYLVYYPKGKEFALSSAKWAIEELSIYPLCIDSVRYEIRLKPSRRGKSRLSIIEELDSDYFYADASYTDFDTSFCGWMWARSIRDTTQKIRFYFHEDSLYFRDSIIIEQLFCFP